MVLSSAGVMASKRSFTKRAWIDPRSLPTAIVAGVVGGLIVLSTSISYPAVIFTGAFEPYLGIGIQMALFGTAVLGATVAVGSSYPAAIANIQIETAVVLGVLSAAIAESLGARGAGAPALATLLAAIVLSTLSLGVVFIALGAFRLGNVIRYIPFPVIGAFLAYIAWLLLRGGLSTMVGQPLSLPASLLLLQPSLLPHWLPGALAAVGLLTLQLVRRHYLNTPVLLVASVAVFWLTVWLTGTSTAELRTAGYLLPGPSPEQSWSPVGSLVALAQADWAVVLRQLPQVVIVWLVGMIALLVIASGVEIASRSDVDLDQELRVAGIGNLLSGLGGGLPGYQSASASLLSHYIGTRSRLVGLISAGICASVLLFGGPLLAYVPKLLLGLVLVYLALGIAADLALDRWPKLPLADRGILLLVLLSLIWLGFVQGIVIGLIAGLAVFAFNYARIDVVRAAGSGARYASNVLRPPAQRRLLVDHGEAIQVIRLQGYLFFGSAHGVLERVSARLTLPGKTPIRYLVLDLERVDGVDSSTVFSFIRLIERADQRGVTILWAAVPETVAAALRSAGLDLDRRTWPQLFLDLDHALEYVEDVLLDRLAGAAPAFDEPTRGFPVLATGEGILAYGTRVTWRAGEHAIRQGEPSEEMYFIETGRLTARLEQASGSHVRLRTILPGTVIGEVACYLGLPRSASVVADQDSSAFRITKDALERMRTENAELAVAFHQFMACAAAERLAHNTALLEGRLD
jgi:sulfate permease, SulP family